MTKRVLLTGMSGTGKSSVIQALAARGFRAVDTDDGLSERGPAGDWVWREAEIGRLLASPVGGGLFVSGCVSNQGRFYERFDHVVLLSAPTEVIVARLASRTGNSWGKAPEELALVLDQIRTVEPLLRRRADHEIDTTAPLAVVVARVLEFVGA